MDAIERKWRDDQNAEMQRLREVNRDLLNALKVVYDNASLFNRDTDSCWVATKKIALDAIAKAESK